MPDKVRAFSKEAREQVKESLQLVNEEDGERKDALYCCWLCNDGPKQPKSRVEEHLQHLKIKHPDYELVPEIIKFQQIHLLVCIAMASKS